MVTEWIPILGGSRSADTGDFLDPWFIVTWSVLEEQAPFAVADFETGFKN